MDLPTYDQFIDPLLRVLSSEPSGIRAADAQERVATLAGLSEEAKLLLLPSGRQPIYKNRIGWAHDRLKRAGLSSSPKRALWVITEAGRDLVATYPRGLPAEEVERLAHVAPDSRVPIDGSHEHRDAREPEAAAVTVETAGPEERIETALQELHLSVAADLLEQIGESTPDFFERLVLDLLHSMGYGSDPEALHKVGKSGDGGIDGIITLDRLGFEKVYVQAKRWQGSVGRPEIQGFFGALAGHRASKGVFITTSTFTREARDYAARVSDSLVLVDGARLTALMIAHGVGVTHRVVRIAKVDSDYFEDG